MQRVDHDCFWIYEEVITPVVRDVRQNFAGVVYMTYQVWSCEECTNDYGNEYVLLVHITPRLLNDEPLDSDLAEQLCDALEDVANQYLDFVRDGDFYIEIQKPWSMNSSIVLPITLQK